MKNEPPSPDSEQQAAQPEADARDYRDVLRDLLDIGLEQAQTLLRDARSGTLTVVAPGDDPDAPSTETESVFDAYVRIAGAVRRTVLLGERLADPS